MDSGSNIEKISGFKGEYSWLSNFAYVPIVYEGVKYPTVEHAYVAAKTLDTKMRILISKAANGATAKKLGKNLKLRDDWETVKDSVMMELLKQKFSTPKYAELLLSTGDAYIEETNWWGDTYWGVCNGVGQNKLGIMIMSLRDSLKCEIGG